MERTDNAFEILGIAGAEDPVSNLLAAVLRDVPHFRDALLGLVGLQGWEVLVAETRSSIDGKIPDISVVVRKSDQMMGLVIENKVFAGEGGGQTAAYSDPGFQAAFRNMFEIPDTSPIKQLYLSLYPEPATSRGFDSFTYEELLERLPAPAEMQLSSVTWTEKLFLDWVHLTTEFYRAGRFAPQVPFAEAFQSRGVLDPSYLFFRNWILAIPTERGLEARRPFRANYRGRPIYGCQIMKAAWAPGGIDITASPVVMDPVKHISIHFEVQYHRLSKTLSLYLHYEPNPYLPASRMKKLVSPDQYEAYQEVRTQFKAKLRSNHPDGWKIGGRTNQVAKAVLAVDGSSSQACADQVGEMINPMAEIVDSIMPEAGDAGFGGGA